jgi:hypothetical protein
LGGFSDKGRDAVHVNRLDGVTTIFRYSVREDWLGHRRVRLAVHQERARGTKGRDKGDGLRSPMQARDLWINSSRGATLSITQGW